MTRREELSNRVLGLTEWLIVKYEQFQSEEIDEYIFTLALSYTEEKFKEIEAEKAVMEMLEEINMN
jgi:hypothetical protein